MPTSHCNNAFLKSGARERSSCVTSRVVSCGKFHDDTSPVPGRAVDLDPAAEQFDSFANFPQAETVAVDLDGIEPYPPVTDLQLYVTIGSSQANPYLPGLAVTQDILQQFLNDTEGRDFHCRCNPREIFIARELNYRLPVSRDSGSQAIDSRRQPKLSQSRGLQPICNSSSRADAVTQKLLCFAKLTCGIIRNSLEQSPKRLKSQQSTGHPLGEVFVEFGCQRLPVLVMGLK